MDPRTLILLLGLTAAALYDYWLII